MKFRFLQVVLTLALSVLSNVHTATAANFAVTTSASPKIAGTTSGGGSFPKGTSVTLTATVTNDCYDFLAWHSGGVVVGTGISITITTKAVPEAFTAFFVLKEYTITTVSSPANEGTTTGGGKKGCGATATLVAHPKVGFRFLNWTKVSDPSFLVTTATCKVPVDDNASYVANFQDAKPPSVRILGPQKNQVIPQSAYAIEGIANDTFGVAAVYFNLNGKGWLPAGSTNNFTNWFAWVSLAPHSPNTLSVYAEDAAGNKATNSVQFSCGAAGYAPLSVADSWVTVTEGTNTQPSFIVSFDLASYVLVSPTTNQQGEVGTYTYTPTGPNTGELIPHRVLPVQDAVSNDSILDLTFSDGFTASYIDKNGGDTGTLTFEPSADTSPGTLDGAHLVGTSYVIPHFTSTNTFGNSTFTNIGSDGSTTIGTYTFTKFSPTAGLLLESPTSPPAAVGKTNFIVLSYTAAEKPPITGNYSYKNLGNDSLDAGSFVFMPGFDETAFLGPEVLTGLQFQVTPDGEPFFTRTYGNGTFASMSLKSSNEPTDVGLFIANTHASPTTGTDQFIALNPPYAVGLDDNTFDVTFGAKSNYNYAAVGDANIKGSAVWGNDPVTGAAALTGYTLTAIPTIKGKNTVLTFDYNIITERNSSDSGTYTYAPYSTSMSLLTVQFKAGSDAGSTQYVVLQFLTRTTGNYVHSQQDATASGGWTFNSGRFTIAATPR
ncbi:MAG TPA: hypothetical protein VGO67_00530 [Verrucomicrobiae bacterium]|jgi:hypothetical protein